MNLHLFPSSQYLFEVFWNLVCREYRYIIGWWISSRTTSRYSELSLSSTERSWSAEMRYGPSLCSIPRPEKKNTTKSFDSMLLINSSIRSFIARHMRFRVQVTSKPIYVKLSSVSWTSFTRQWRTEWRGSLLLPKRSARLERTTCALAIRRQFLLEKMRSTVCSHLLLQPWQCFLGSQLYAGKPSVFQSSRWQRVTSRFHSIWGPAWLIKFSSL